MVSLAAGRFSASYVQGSAIAAIAYAAGLRLRDERTGVLHNYSSRRRPSREDVVRCAHVVPGGDVDAGLLWNRVMRRNLNRKAVFLRTLILSLAKELSLEGMWRALMVFARYLRRKYKVAVMVALHGPRRLAANEHESAGDLEQTNGNWHAHVYMSYCNVHPDGSLGLKEIRLDPKSCEAHGLPNFSDVERATWVGCLNRQLTREGIHERVDHRSLVARGSSNEPTEPLGPQRAALEAKGIRTDRGRRNAAVRQRNASRARFELHQRRAQFARTLLEEAVASGQELGPSDINYCAHTRRWWAHAMRMRHAGIAFVRRELDLIVFDDGGGLVVADGSIVVASPGCDDVALGFLDDVRYQMIVEAADRESQAEDWAPPAPLGRPAVAQPSTLSSGLQARPLTDEEIRLFAPFRAPRPGETLIGRVAPHPEARFEPDQEQSG